MVVVSQDIIEIADFVRDLVGVTNKVNIDTLEVFDTMGIALEVDPTLEQPLDICYTKETNKYSIKLREEYNGEDVYFKFRLFHELGHIVIHCLLSGGYEKYKETYWMNSVEHEANTFAANFLMPKQIFYSVASRNLESGGHYNLNGIAKEFGLAVNTVRARGHLLRLFI
jgi:hypothetical protein